MDCLFCSIVAGDIPSMKVDEDELTIAIMDINPAVPGHVLVMPKRHAANVLEVGPEDLSAVALAAQRMARRVTEKLGAEGVSISNACGAVAGQTVFHLHFHVIPRHAGDPLRLPWTPTTGDMAEIAAVAAQLNA